MVQVYFVSTHTISMKICDYSIRFDISFTTNRMVRQCSAQLLWSASVSGRPLRERSWSRGFLSLAASAYFERCAPAMLVSGTRYLFLSRTVFVHRKLHRFGSPVSLHLIEGISHYQKFSDPVADESQDAFVETTIFRNENRAEWILVKDKIWD